MTIAKEKNIVIYIYIYIYEKTKYLEDDCIYS